VKRVIKRVIIGLVVFQAGMVVTGLLMRRLFPSHGDEDSDELGLTTILTGTELRSRADAFRGGSVFTFCGGTELDLRDAVLAPGGAVLRTHTICGGLDVRVPRDWRVVVDGKAVMGGFDDRTDGDDLPEDAPLLAISGDAVAGGVSVRR
jgi:hypothetical protein